MSVDKQWSVRRSPKNFTILGKIGIALILPICLIVLWQISIGSGWLPENIINNETATPAAVAEYVRQSWVELIRHAWNSFTRVAFGFLLGGIPGLLVGVLVGSFLAAERVVAPTLQGLIPIPPPAWIPLLIILIGIGEGMKVTLIAIGSFGLVYFNTYRGIRDLDRKLFEVGEVYLRSRLSRVLFVYVPGALASITKGAREALTLGWILLIAAEPVAAKLDLTGHGRAQAQGLAWLIFDANRFSHFDRMLAGMLMLGVLAFIVDQFMKMLEKRALRWREAFEGV